jgi:hypothetical protein
MKGMPQNHGDGCYRDPSLAVREFCFVYCVDGGRKGERVRWATSRGFGLADG